MERPRLTIDVDIVVDLKPRQVKPLVAAFPIPNYYASEEGILDSLQKRYPFNIIQSTTGAKIDMVPLFHDPFSRSVFERRQRLIYDTFGRSAMFITPEDIIIAKLMAHQETGSDKHLRDARGVLLIQWDDLDMESIRHGAKANKVLENLEKLLDMLGRGSRN